MASNAFSSASCDLCSELVTDPRILQCLHSFCKKCLQKHFEEQGSKQNLICPTCDGSSTIPEGGVEILPKDLRRSYEAEVAQYEAKVKRKTEISCDRCIESSDSCVVVFCCACCKLLCKQCKEDHLRWRETYKHELVEVGETKKKISENLLSSIPHKLMNCEFHIDEVLKFYCETCCSLICRDCILLKHKDHKYDHIEALAKKEKANLLSILGAAESATTKLGNARAQGEKMKQRVHATQKSVENDITQTFEGLRKSLNSREKTLKAKALEIGLSKCTALDIQNEDLEKVQDEISKTYKMINSALQVYTPTEILSVKCVMAGKLRKHMEKFCKCSLEPCKSEMMPYLLDSGELAKEIASFGVVTGGCYAGGSTAALYIPRAIRGREKEIVITTRNLQKELYPNGGEVVRSTLSLMGSNDLPVVGKVVDKENGTYVVSFTPQAVGKHELAITISNEPIKLSPFMINVREPRVYTTLSSSRQLCRVSEEPLDVACGDNGDVFVTGHGNHCISVFNKSGSKINTIGTAGNSVSGDGQFNKPLGLAIRGDVIYVTEEGNHRVQKISTSGKFISKFGTNGTGEGELHKPYGICIDHEGRVYVSEFGNNRVSVFTADGRFQYHITGDSAEGNNLGNPWGVAFDPSGNLHVTNYNAHLVKVFTPLGKYITQYGSGTIQSPGGIAIDAEGYCFVSQSTHSGSHLCIFDPQYKHVHTIQDFGRAVGVCIDNDGYVYVADQNNNHVTKY